jgi:hypothetical protein
MKIFNLKTQTTLLILALLAVACHQQQERTAKSGAPPPPPAAANDTENSLMADSTFRQLAEKGAATFSSSAARIGAIDSVKTFIRTAEMRFRTPEVLTATLKIEDIARRNGGFVSSNELSTDVESTAKKPFGRDSALEMTRFHLNCHLVLRVPFRQLDTTLRTIGQLAERMDYRRITAQDIELDLLEKALQKAREQDYQSQLSAAAAGAKPDTRIEAASRTHASREGMDAGHLQMRKLLDQVHFSTVTLDLYGFPQYREVAISDKDPDAEQRHFFRRFADAFRQGGAVLEALILGVVHLWAVILLAVCLVWGYRRFKNK